MVAFLIQADLFSRLMAANTVVVSIFKKSACDCAINIIYIRVYVSATLAYVSMLSRSVVLEVKIICVK